MPFSPKSALAILFCGLLWATAAQAQRAEPQGFPDAPAPTMWQDHRQDRTGWEGVLYRMVGRGALWTEDEIRTMADYLAAAYGRQAAASK